jgi:hypothetical protein
MFCFTAAAIIRKLLEVIQKEIRVQMGQRKTVLQIDE